MSAVVNTSRAISTEELDGDDEFPKSVHKKQKTIAEIPVKGDKFHSHFQTFVLYEFM